MMTGQAATGEARTPVDAAAFMAALEERRNRVYSYLDSWPGAADFQPADIHDAIYSYIGRRGKALRPVLLLLCCGAVGGDEGQALPAAAALEVFHTWTLVHDDIIDRDDKRRGYPTVHSEYAEHGRTVFSLDGDDAVHYGQAVAILAGDLQQSWAYALLSSVVDRGVEPRLAMSLVQRMANWLTPSLLEGEMLDVQYSLTPFEGLTEDEVLAMLTKKTGALLEFGAWCGAKIGLGSRPDPNACAEKLARFASLCGTAFQLHDDLLGLTADEVLLGKPVGSDLREGKRTLILYRALARADQSQREVLLSVLGDSQASSSDIAHALETIRLTGALNDIQELANSLISQAAALLEALPPSEYRDLLSAWSGFVLERKN